MRRFLRRGEWTERVLTNNVVLDRIAVVNLMVIDGVSVPTSCFDNHFLLVVHAIYPNHPQRLVEIAGHHNSKSKIHFRASLSTEVTCGGGCLSVRYGRLANAAHQSAVQVHPHPRIRHLIHARTATTKTAREATLRPRNVDECRIPSHEMPA